MSYGSCDSEFLFKGICYYRLPILYYYKSYSTVVKYSWPAFTMVIIIKTTVLCTYYSTAAYTDNRDAGERCSFTVMYLKNPFVSALSTSEREVEI